MTVEVHVQPATREDAQRIIRGLMELAKEQDSPRQSGRESKKQTARGNGRS